MGNNKLVGDLGEEFATKLLRLKGYEILETKYYCKLGEIDIIAKKENELFFIEVKTRQSLAMGSPAESVTSQKRERIRRVARYYIYTEKVEYEKCSFQVIEVLTNHIENAF
ncbi:MAG: YraN family protein [Anaerovoracaceae bacterium]